MLRAARSAAPRREERPSSAIDGGSSHNRQRARRKGCGEGLVTARRVDAVVVGGGVAGLASAWLLRGRDVLLLEADTRGGGRIFFPPRGEDWPDWGGHVFGGPGSGARPVPGEIGVQGAPV